MVETRRTVLECLGGKRGLFLGAFAKLRKTTVNFVLSVRPSVRPPAWNNSAPTGRIFMEFDI